MIFDDSFEDLKVLKPNQNINNKSHPEISLDNFIEKRQNEMVLQNLDNIYSLYKIQINRDFFQLPALQSNNQENKRDRSKKRLSTQEESCYKNSFEKKSLKQSLADFSLHEQ